jgi:hypothetical protein
MEEAFHEKVFRYQPNVIIWFSAIQSAGERWRELLERASAIYDKKQESASAKRKRSFSPKKLPRP